MKIDGEKKERFNAKKLGYSDVEGRKETKTKRKGEIGKS